MTFYEISMKMLLANIRRYRLYFLCNLFAVVLFYCFASLLTNRRFMDIRVVDSMISGNIIAPTLFAGVFLVLFIPYSYGAFLRNRKREYGILMALGMSEADVLKNMIAEACTVAALSLLCGLSLGMGVSYLFYAFVQKVIGVTELQWQWNGDSYQLTALVYGAAMLLTLVTALIGFKKARVVELLKEKFKAEGKGSRASPWFFAAGAILVAASVVIMLIGYGKADGWFLASLGTMFAGSWLAFMHAGSVGKQLAKWMPGFSSRCILGLSFARQHDRSRRRIGFIAAWMIGFSVFFTGFGAAMAPSLTRNALKQTPYDLVYSQIFGKNQVGDAEVESLLNRYGVSAQPLKQADYLRSKAFNVLSASETNQTFGCNYSVQEGEFLEVFQFDTKDGYEHDKAMPKSLAFSCAGETLELRPAGSDFRVLFNGNPTFADWTLIVNDVDYARLASQCRDFWKGTMKLYTLDNWQGSAKGIDAVQQLLAQRNNNADAADQRYYRATSRIETYTTAQQSMEFFYFVMVFIVLLFCGASFIIVLFKTRAESEEERRMLAGLNRIGVTKEEMRSALRFKNMLYFMPQVLVGLPLGMFFIIMVAGFYGYGAAAAAYSLLAGIVLFSLHWLGAMKLGSIKI